MELAVRAVDVILVVVIIRKCKETERRGILPPTMKFGKHGGVNG